MIRVENLCKSFRIPEERHYSLRNRILSSFRPMKFRTLQVLDRVSFHIEKGECVGLIGRNGCGKSTLLKLLSGILVPDSGTIEVGGAISPFLELGVGFNHELSVKDNIHLYAAVLGLTERETTDKYEQILEFAELKDFEGAKLKTLSSGMQVRAAYSVASQIDAEIYLADEVLAVGDARFQEKCFRQFSRMREAGKTILYVSHDLASVEKFCDRVIWLDNGRIAANGPAKDVIASYIDSLHIDTPGQKSRPTEECLTLEAEPTEIKCTQFNGSFELSMYLIVTSKERSRKYEFRCIVDEKKKPEVRISPTKDVLS